MKEIKFDRTKPYNQLPKLPPNIQLFDIEIYKQWGIASRKLAELNKNLLRIPNSSMLVNTITLQEAKKSTEIENIFTTDDLLYKAISDNNYEENTDPATKEVLRYRQALWAGYNTIKEEGIINEKTIIEIFQKIKDTKQTFRSPQSQVVIRRGQSEFRPGEIIYNPPRGIGVIEDKMNDLLKFLNNYNTEELDPLLKMAIAHYQFEAIHPFFDGNGRSGRILNLIYLVHSNLLSHPVLFMSNYILKNKSDYYYNLSGVTNRGDWKSWILFMLKAVEITAEQTNNCIDDILNQMDATYSFAKEKLKWYSLELNLLLFSQPYIKPNKIGELLEISSRTTLTKYMKELIELNILSTKQSGKEVFYLNNELLRILS